MGNHQSNKPDLTPFFRLLAVPVDDKGDALRAQIAALNSGARDAAAPGETFTVDPADFGQIPGSPFAYWVGESIRRLFETLPPVESEGRIVRLGDHPDNQNRYLRLFWEVPPVDRSETRKWIPYQKGGAYSPFYYDIHLVVDWDLERETYYDFHGRPGRSNERPSNFQLFFRPGLTWPRRTNGFSVRVLPCDCIFADKGPVVLVENDSPEILFSVLAVMNSAPFEMLVRVQLARTELAQSYDVGIIQRTPIPDLRTTDYALRTPLASLAREAHDLQRERDHADETTHAFCLPGLVTHRDAPTLQDAGLRLDAEERARQSRLAAIQAEIDARVFDLYGLSESDRALVLREMGGKPIDDLRLTIDEQEIENRQSEIENEDEEILPSEDLPVRVQNLLLWCVGVAFGRWDLRKALDPTLLPPLGGPFDPLPRTAPGARDLRFSISDLRLPDEIVNRQSEIVNQGILPDDPTHPDDLIGRVQAILRVLYGARAEAIEAEACALLGFDSLRAYFRDPRKGLFAFHIKRYSKSRRKSPIYWLLQSERRNYGIWLYSHRLEKYALYSAARDYADYKVNFEQGRLDDLKDLLTRLEGPERRRRERELTRQQQVVDEVRAFRKRLDAVAIQDLFIDLNDGVLISLAPLWELVPWKEAARGWEQLLAGDYEWSTMAQRLREKGLIADKGK